MESPPLPHIIKLELALVADCCQWSACSASPSTRMSFILLLHRHLECAVLCCAVLCCVVLYCFVLCCVVLCCVVLCCVVLCCVVLCCAVLCCVMFGLRSPHSKRSPPSALLLMQKLGMSAKDVWIAQRVGQIKKQAMSLNGAAYKQDGGRETQLAEILTSQKQDIDFQMVRTLNTILDRVLSPQEVMICCVGDQGQGLTTRDTCVHLH